MPHSRGEPIKLRADLQNRLEDFALSELTGGKNPRDASPFAEAVVVRALNTTANLIDRDATAHLGLLVLDPDQHLQARRVPAIEIGTPTVASIGRFVIAMQPIAPNAFGPVAIAGVCVAMVKIHNASDGFATIDPEDPKRLRSSDTGEAKIVARAAAAAANDERLCMIRFGYAHLVKWRYRRVSGAIVNLVRLDGADYYNPCQVTITVGADDLIDEGYCYQIGHQFAAIPSDSSIYGFVLGVDKLAETTSAAATIYELNGTAFGTEVGHETLYDPAQWYGPVVAGTKGLCIKKGTRYYAYQSPCSAAEYL